MRIEREELAKALHILEEEGSLVIEARPRAGLTLFLSQIGTRVTSVPQGGILYLNAAIPSPAFFEHLALRLGLGPEKHSLSTILDALAAASPIALLIDSAEALNDHEQQQLKTLLKLFSSERVFSSRLAQSYIVVGTRSPWQEARLELGFFTRSEVAALVKRSTNDHVALALYAWGRGAPELTRELVTALHCRENNVATVYRAVVDAASRGKLHYVAKRRPSVEELRRLGLADERSPLPAVSLALKLLDSDAPLLTINRTTMEVRHRGRLVALFPQETRILCLLSASPGQIFTPSQIYAAITSGDVLYLGEKSVKSQISRLRAKLPQGTEWILTRRGLGYAFNPQSPCEFI